MSKARRIRAALSLLVVLLAAGCALFDPTSLPLGTPAADVRAKLGVPTAEHTIAGGTRLEYATGPYGKSTWMLDFDSAGTLRAVRQVLTEADFNAVQTGMTAEELRTAIGRPSDIQRIPWQRRMLWSYRYFGYFCQIFQAEIDEDGKVVGTGYGLDPMCEVHDRGSHRN
jgi:hypothetical protein